MGRSKDKVLKTLVSVHCEEYRFGVDKGLWTAVPAVRINYFLRTMFLMFLLSFLGEE